MSKPNKKNLRPTKKMRWQMRDVTKKAATHKKTKDKPKRIVLAAALALSLLTSPADDFAQRYELWENAPLGIAVTRCDYSTRGVHVRFETDLEPPYVVGVYRICEEGLGHRFPVAETETETKEAFVRGDFHGATVFVQVMAKSALDYYMDEVGRRTLTQAEWERHVRSIRDVAPFVNTNSNFTFELESNNSEELIADHTWVGFAKTDQTDFCVDVKISKAEPDVESIVTNIVQDVIYTNVSANVLSNGDVEYVRTNSGAYASVHLGGSAEHSYSVVSNAYGGYFSLHIYRYPQYNDHEQVVTNFSSCNYHMVPYEDVFRIRNGRNDIGTGYRLVLFDDTGVFQAQRAYSARTNMSDVVVLPAGFRSLSSNNGYIYTTDWEGRRYFQRVTNRVDHVLGGGGQ